MDFFVYSIPIIVLTFIFFHVLFKKTSIFKNLLKKFAFYGFITVFLFEGNIEYLSYCCFNQLRLSFSFNFLDKVNLILAVLFLLLLMVFCFSIFFLFLWLYKKKSESIMEDSYSNLPSIVVYSLIFNCRYFILGAIQSLLY